MNNFEIMEINNLACAALAKHCFKSGTNSIVADATLTTNQGEMVLTLSIGQNLFKSEMRITRGISLIAAKIAVKQFNRTLEGKSHYEAFKHFSRHWEFKSLNFANGAA